MKPCHQQKHCFNFWKGYWKFLTGNDLIQFFITSHIFLNNSEMVNKELGFWFFLKRNETDFFFYFRLATLIVNQLIDANSSPIILMVKCESAMIRVFPLVTFSSVHKMSGHLKMWISNDKSIHFCNNFFCSGNDWSSKNAVWLIESCHQDITLSLLAWINLLNVSFAFSLSFSQILILYLIYI